MKSFFTVSQYIQLMGTMSCFKVVLW